MIKILAETYLKDRKLDNFEQDANDIYTFLSHTTYTHIRPYCKSFYLGKKIKEFKPNVSFNDIKDLYCFDKLFAKELFFFLIEIERKLKSMLIDLFFIENSGCCMFDKNVFDVNSKDFKKIDTKINSLFGSDQDKSKYPKDMGYYLNSAFWVVIKDFSFGKIRIMISALKQKHIINIMNNLNINIKLTDFKKKLVSINYLRNALAHDKHIYIKYDYKVNPATNIYDVVLEIHNMLDSRSQYILKENLSRLFTKYSSSLQKHNLKTYTLFDTFLR